jgi:transcriptional regulator with XRE-family HTH domain
LKNGLFKQIWKDKMLKQLIGRKLKSSRLKRDLTIQELAGQSGVSSNMISRIERGLTIPSVELLLKLADAFGVSLSYFVEDAEKGGNVVQTPAGYGAPVFFFENKHQVSSLTEGLRDSGFSVYLDTLEPLCNSGDGHMIHSGEEFAMVLEGSVSFNVGGEDFFLEKGDSIALKASVPHRWNNPAQTTAKILWVVAPSPSV